MFVAIACPSERWPPQATQIKLSNLPLTAKPDDIRRLVARSQAPGVDKIAIEYRDLEPTGCAVLNLTNTNHLSTCLNALESVSISGVHPKAEPERRTLLPTLVNGLSSELQSNDRHVVVSGLPKGLGPAEMDQMLRRWHFRPRNGETSAVVLAARDKGRTDRYLVHLDSVSEAHRLVRLLHMAYYDPAVYGQQYPLRARVIY
ncbi:hypothetical protein MKEN_01174900 [Mycena kentingensis (nom. inval.)]|nr:hypothetical protein MKEN_01174900 [Mycena kentingensis (nom. inval.)]